MPWVVGQNLELSIASSTSLIYLPSSGDRLKLGKRYVLVWPPPGSRPQDKIWMQEVVCWWGDFFKGEGKWDKEGKVVKKKSQCYQDSHIYFPSHSFIHSEHGAKWHKMKLKNRQRIDQVVPSMPFYIERILFFFLKSLLLKVYMSSSIFHWLPYSSPQAFATLLSRTFLSSETTT